MLPETTTSRSPARPTATARTRWCGRSRAGRPAARSRRPRPAPCHRCRRRRPPPGPRPGPPPPPHPAGVAGQGLADRLPGHDVPDPYRPIAAAGDDHLAIPGPAHRHRLTLPVCPVKGWPTGCPVPVSQTRTVPSCRRRQPPRDPRPGPPPPPPPCRCARSRAGRPAARSPRPRPAPSHRCRRRQSPRGPRPGPPPLHAPLPCGRSGSGADWLTCSGWSPKPAARIAVEDNRLGQVKVSVAGRIDGQDLGAGYRRLRENERRRRRGRRRRHRWRHLRAGPPAAEPS